MTILMDLFFLNELLQDPWIWLDVFWKWSLVLNMGKNIQLWCFIDLTGLWVAQFSVRSFSNLFSDEASEASSASLLANGFRSTPPLPITLGFTGGGGGRSRPKILSKRRCRCCDKYYQVGLYMHSRYTKRKSTELINAEITNQ